MGRIGSWRKLVVSYSEFYIISMFFFAYHHSFVAINWGGTDPERSGGKF